MAHLAGALGPVLSASKAPVPEVGRRATRLGRPAEEAEDTCGIGFACLEELPALEEPAPLDTASAALRPTRDAGIGIVRSGICAAFLLMRCSMGMTAPENL